MLKKKKKKKKKKKQPTTTKVNEESISGKTILKSEGEAKTLPDKS